MESVFSESIVSAVSVSSVRADFSKNKQGGCE